MRKIVAIVCAACVAITGISSLAQDDPTRPEQGLRDRTPRLFALTNARIVTPDPDKRTKNRLIEIEHGTLVIDAGEIKAVGSDVKIPAGARVIDLTGKTVYPGLIDAYSETKVPAPPDGTGYWNKQIRPQVNVADHYTPDAKLNEQFRGQGIVARLVAPSAGVIRGTSVVVTTADGDSQTSIIRPLDAQHVRLTVDRSRSGGYPRSPMGAVALARQALYDAQWHTAAVVLPLHDDDRSQTVGDARVNTALASLFATTPSEDLPLELQTTLYFKTDHERSLLRAKRFADEFKLKAVFVGSGREYRRPEAMRVNAIIVPVDFPKAPNVSTPEAALNVSLQELMHWDLAPTNPARVAEHNPDLALTSHGLDDRKKFLAAVRKAVDYGLDQDTALRSLTINPARLLNIDKTHGTLAAGKTASFIVTDGDLFAEKTRIVETWVDGRRFEHKPEPTVDPRGTWKVTMQGVKGKPRSLTVEIAGESDKPSAKVVAESTDGVESDVALKHVAIVAAQLTGVFDSSAFGAEGVARLSVTVTRNGDGEAIWKGRVVWPSGRVGWCTAKRAADDKPDKEDVTDEDKDEDKADDPAPLFDVNYPLGAFGVTKQPGQPTVLFRNATVWTCGPAGVLKGASVLVRDGKIVAVGQDVERPKGKVVIVDCKGKHITPGMIDCHSHIATDGGVNESGQAITSEVRIGDFVNGDDIAIYRQLAGGTTTANILHGSANPIGGQNQVIKFRWGMTGEAMKFKAAKPGIKFALGENVKQSNWSNPTGRYPQTRMGVEQIMRDAFRAARDYQRAWDEWKKHKKGVPPRRDLELDALAEVMSGDRIIHCHSYRQDEILALIRVCDDFGVKIGTFQHVLEGYKVADAIAKHGAGGSSFSDWWAYKFEVYDAIPHNGALMHGRGVVVSFNSDDAELGRRMNTEAAKATKYGGVPPEQALLFVTLNPARQLRIDHRVGSIEPGKDADIVVWNGQPMSTFTRCEQTWVDGRKVFDRHADLKQRQRVSQMRAKLIQRILDSGEPMKKAGEKSKADGAFWENINRFCEHCDQNTAAHRRRLEMQGGGR